MIEECSLEREKQGVMRRFQHELGFNELYTNDPFILEERGRAAEFMEAKEISSLVTQQKRFGESLVKMERRNYELLL